MFIDGNMSTGIWTTLTPPRMAMIRQATMMRYGVLIANRDMHSLRLRRQIASQADHFRLNSVTVLESGARSHYHVITLLQVAGQDLSLARGLDAEAYRNDLNLSVGLHLKDARGASRAVDGLSGNREHVLLLLGHQIHFGVHSGDQYQRWIGHVDFRFHGPGGLVDSVRKASHSSRKAAMHGRHPHFHRFAQMDQRNSRFRQRQRGA